MIDYAIQCSGLRVVRGREEVLAGLEFTAPAGSVTGLLGPSGSGKTTLIRSIVGTQVIRAGSVTVLGLPAGDPALRNQVGYSSQGASVYGDLTVAENIRYFATVLGTPRDDVDRVLAEVELARYAGRLAGRLSGGQRSRVSLAIAMLGAPRLLVLDEPTVGLDPVLREELWSLFGELAASGTTLLISSHVMDEAERCDELVLLREGRLVAQDRPLALKRRTGADTMDGAFLELVRAAA
jgi:ABC-2 type transport system ATP-binding protein